MKQSRTNRRRRKRVSPIKSAIRNGHARVSSYINARSAITVGGNFKVGITVFEVAKYTVYAILGLLMLLLQVTLFSRLKPFGSIPDILIVSVFSVSMFEGKQAGAIFGVVLGFLADCIGGVGVTLLPLIYMLVGYIAGLIADEYYKRSVLLFLIFDFSSLLVRMFTTFLYIVFTRSTVDISVILPKVLIPEALSTFVISPLPAIVFSLTGKLFNRDEAPKPGLD